MSIGKQKLYNEIETLPEELTNQVINFIEYLKLSYIETLIRNEIIKCSNENSIKDFYVEIDKNKISNVVIGLSNFDDSEYDAILNPSILQEV